ncbi:LysM peptidoglycan-binding domain-containing protein, partial [Enterococcus faecium]
SVWLIANRYGVSMDDFVKWNKIKNNTIHPGQVLTIQSIVSTPAKPTITTTPKVDAKPAITTTPKAEAKPGVTTTPKIEQKTGVTTTPKVKEQPAITTVPKTESEVLIEKANGSKKEYKYSHSVIEKAKLDPLYHNFPKSLDGGILSKPLVTRTDGRIEHLVRGAINGEKGVYHITVKGDSIIHRAFIPESDWARFSKVNELPGLGEIPSLK